MSTSLLPATYDPAYSFLPVTNQAVLVVSGEDRPGVMDELTQFLMDCDANILDSRSSNLGGQFALLMLIRATDANLTRVHDGLKKMDTSGLRYTLSDASPIRIDGFPFTFKATGTDQAGVLHRLSHLLRVMNVNILQIATHVQTDQRFELTLNLLVPRETPIKHLRDYLDELCKQLGIEGTLAEA